MDFVEKEYGATRIFVHPTWLNSCSRWLAIFPEEWLEHLTPELEDVAWHYGFWGQFMVYHCGNAAKHCKVAVTAG